MNNYNLRENVHWKKILKTLRWNLEIKIENYNNCNEKFNNFQLLKTMRNEIYDSYISYNSLRKFLGYTKITKIESKAKNIFENIE